jgi:hypothetical protein
VIRTGTWLCQFCVTFNACSRDVHAKLARFCMVHFAYPLELLDFSIPACFLREEMT